MVRALVAAVLMALVGAAGLGVVPATAPARAEQPGSTGRVPMPQPPKGQGERCVADTDFMRRNHMTMLKHQRDDTVHQGLRKPAFSLAGCIGCHAVSGTDGKAVSFAAPQHFCRSCHTYAAVQVDCFECHASRPETSGKAAAAPADEQQTAALAHYLRSKQP